MTVSRKTLLNNKRVVTTTMKRLCILLIRAYRRLLSPLFPPSCRFYPSCSQYAIDAITIHGLAKGLFMGLGRILRCHPFNPGGYDPVIPDPAMQRKQSNNLM